MNNQLLKGAFGWGVVLWLIGYVLGIALVFVMPTSIVGWIIMPIGILITLWVLHTRVRGATFNHFVVMAVVWTMIAMLFDYLFIVQAFKPADGYYKLDVYLYYALTFILPLVIGWRKSV